MMAKAQIRQLKKTKWQQGFATLIQHLMDGKPLDPDYHRTWGAQLSHELEQVHSSTIGLMTFGFDLVGVIGGSLIVLEKLLIHRREYVLQYFANNGRKWWLYWRED